MKKLEINPNGIMPRNLVEGRLYADQLEKNIVVLEFVEYDEEGDPLFKHVAGPKCYSEDVNGLIPFPKEGDVWFEVISM